MRDTLITAMLILLVAILLLSPSFIMSKLKELRAKERALESRYQASLRELEKLKEEERRLRLVLSASEGEGFAVEMLMRTHLLAPEGGIVIVLTRDTD